jgi:hypothetical protein
LADSAGNICKNGTEVSNISVSIGDHVVEFERLSWDAGRWFYLDWFENLAEE